MNHTFTDAADRHTFIQPTPRPAGQAGQFGSAGDGWYSYNLGHWHIISLNAECATQPGGCSPSGSWLASETEWLAQDLRSNRAMCTMAYWHQPAFSSTNPASSSPVPTSGSAEGQASEAWWKRLYAHHADLVLNGHEHVYACFARWTRPETPIPVTGSGSSSSAPAARAWTRSPRLRPTSRPRPTITTGR